MTPKVTVEWLALLFHIQEVMGSNAGLETRYPDKIFHGFLQFLQAKARVILISYYCLPLHNKVSLNVFVFSSHMMT
jgi:hypothetical protein